MKKLLYTTHCDLSVPQFNDWGIEYYDNCDPTKKGDLVYLRDPFNDPNYRPDTNLINQILANHRGAKIVDRITSYQDLYELEDKYLQAQRFGELSPRTWLPSEHTFVPGKNLAKPRISQRAKDILFELGDRQLDDSWIIQALLDIQEELRVYVVGGKIMDQVSIKSSKANGPVKVIGMREIKPAEREFIQQAMQFCNLDLIGFDLAILPNGKYQIIEANRSPQFKRYYENTGINLVDHLDDIK